MSGSKKDHGFVMFCLYAAMPPFGKESSEPNARPLPFLSLSHAPNAAKARRKATRAFASEAAERVTPSVPKNEPFRKQPRLAQLPFQNEDAESNSHSSTTRKQRPFGDEDSEHMDSNSDSAGEDDFKVTSSSVFSLGWQNLMSFKNSSFWKNNQDDKTGAKPKRKYDNSKRKSEALYIKKDNAGALKKRGSDPARINSLLDEPTCRCSMDANVYLLICLTP